MKRVGVLLLLQLLIWTAPSLAAPEKFIIDSDGADYDDIFNLMLATVSPEVEIVGVVATGNDIEPRARMLAKVLSIMGRDDVHVYLGSGALGPLPKFPYPIPPRHYGLRPEMEKWVEDYPTPTAPQSGVEFYLDQILRAPGTVSVMVTGGLSTLARAMQLADQQGRGAEFRAAIPRVLFSGGDFKHVEYNIWSDETAARVVFRSGVTIYQFGGEGDKALLTYPRRQRLWAMQTPASWALQDVYRFWHAGWDPRTPFVPTLDDAHTMAFVLVGARATEVEPAAVDLDSKGIMVRVQGPPNAYVRVANHGDAIADLGLDRLQNNRGIAAANHLRAIQRLAGPGPVSAALAPALDQLESGQASDPASVAKLLDGAEPTFRSLGARAPQAEEHLRMARGFLVGEPRANPWRDPYTPTLVTLYIPVCKLYAAFRRAGMASPVILAIGGFGLIMWRNRRSRPRPPKRPAPRTAGLDAA